MRATAAVLGVALLCAPAAARAQEAPPPAPARDTPFPDVPRTHWAFDAVEQMRKLGILRGYPPERRTAPAPRRASAAKNTAPAARRK